MLNLRSGGHLATTQNAGDADITQDGGYPAKLPPSVCYRGTTQRGYLITTKGGSDLAIKQGSYATTHGKGEGLGKLQWSQLNTKNS